MDTPLDTDLVEYFNPKVKYRTYTILKLQYRMIEQKISTQ